MDDLRLHGFASSDGENPAARETLEIVASRFADEVRLGLRPRIDDYVARHPNLADEIRELFPLVETLEGWKVEKETQVIRDSLPEQLPFRQFGRYRVLREIGRGGMGVVFEAASKSGKRVAVKVLPWRFTADSARRKERFRREATTIAELRHRNIVPVYFVGEHEGYCYYVMQLIEGVSIAWIIRRLRETAEPIHVGEVLSAGRGVAESHKPQSESPGIGRDSWNGFAKIGVQVALGLGHAHKHKVLHNDIKPANLLLNARGRVVITDFGVGRIADSELAVDQESGLGTLRYMAPERFMGQSGVRSDVYSLGATLYELITQQPAFDAAERGELLERVLQSRFVRPRKLNPQIPRDLETIVLKAMSLDPEQRYATARSLAADLVRFINGDPIHARPPGFFRDMVRWYFRRK